MQEPDHRHRRLLGMAMIGHAAAAPPAHDLAQAAHSHHLIGEPRALRNHCPV
jgi:hypothetical protein